MISKTTTNFAEKRGLTVEEMSYKDLPAIWIFEEGNDCEPEAVFFANEDGSFTFTMSLLPREIKEELPATIRDEKHLREVLKFISKEMEAIEY